MCLVDIRQSSVTGPIMNGSSTLKKTDGEVDLVENGPHDGYFRDPKEVKR
jgi:hypothetical protein